jgi:glycosyltransferase involved in cell wall biosynthesis
VSDPPIVRVVITTFDHERFIARAVESVITQEAPFPYEVIVIDDCSTDGTAAVLDELAERHPGRFTVRRPSRNRNDHRDFGAALDECTSPYLAMLDGDDYWTSTTKLATQVAFLDDHPEYVMAGHAVQRVDSDGAPVNPVSEARPGRYTRDDLWSYCIVQAGSVVFRRAGFDELPAWYFESVAGDWELYLLLTVRGDVWLADERMSAYRQHPGGSWSNLDLRRQADQMRDFYRHQERAWGRSFRTNRAATLSRAVTLEDWYSRAGAHLVASRWLVEAVVRSTLHRPGPSGPSRRDVRRMVAWRVKSVRDRMLRGDGRSGLSADRR